MERSAVQSVLFNVLTRVSRPRYFEACRQSVAAQVHRPVRHVVTIDSDECATAVRDLPELRVERKQPGVDGSFPFNLYLNRLYDLVEDGWVLFLDDDDLLSSPWSLADLAGRISADGCDPDVLYLWKVWFPHFNSVVPRQTFGQVPTLGDVDSAGVCFHSKHLPAATWDANKCGDFRVIRQLHQSLPRTVWIDRVLTAIQDKAHGGDTHDLQAPEPPRLPDELDRIAALLAQREMAAADLERSRAEWATSTAELQGVRDDLAATKARLHASNDELAATKAQWRESRAEAMRSAGELRRLEAENERLSASKSWRWSAPARGAAEIVRRALVHRHQ
jgi:hypothetical protein